jgi:hypothetical protein
MDDGISFQTVNDSVTPNLFQKKGFSFLTGCELLCLIFILNAEGGGGGGGGGIPPFGGGG